MLARLIGTDDEEGGVIVISMNGREITGMNCLAYGHRSQPYPRDGDEFLPEFECLFADDESVNEIINGNPDEETQLHRTGLWSYRALGKIMSVAGPDSEVMVSCGPCLLPAPIASSDPSLIGKFIGFNVKRLDIWLA